MGLNTDEVVIEEQDIPTYVASLPVPNVQEMVRKNHLQFPERYKRSQEEMPKAIDMTHLSSEIPIIDLLLLSNRQGEELKKLDMACQEWGFFQASTLDLHNYTPGKLIPFWHAFQSEKALQVINHGVATELLQNMKDAAAGFFNLPLEEKNKCSMSLNDIQGYGHAYVVSEEQKLDWYDTMILVIYPSKFQRPKFWPATQKQFKEITEAYSTKIRRVAEELLGSISLVMGLDKDSLLAMHKVLMQALRINYYPTCSKPDQVQGISPHSDKNTISILLQEDNVNGLQIRHEGEWVPVRPIPNALVVNIGDVIEIWSNGKYRSIENRAVTNENRARISFASFLYPHDDAEIDPFDHMVDSSRPFRMYKEVTYGDYLRQSMKLGMQGKQHIQIAKNGT